MRRKGNLFDSIVDRGNMRLAVFKAMKGKRHRSDVREWVANIDSNLNRVTEQLLSQTFPVGRAHQFVIYDPKERIITAPCFEERMVHHAIMNVCEPCLDNIQIFDSYACRKGKGRLACLERVRVFASQYQWFYKLDIRKFFDSVSHARILELWKRKFKDPRLFFLMESIVRGYRHELGIGLPIGSLVSQHLANYYLGFFDRFIKETMRIHGYTRYMDDIALWGNDPAALREFGVLARTFLREELLLEIKDSPYGNRCSHGMDYLGCRVFSTHITLNRRSRIRFQRKWRWLEQQNSIGAISENELQARSTALVSFTRTPGLCTWKFRQHVLNKLEVGGRKARTV